MSPQAPMLNVWVVEDQEMDVVLLREQLKDAAVDLSIRVIETGQELLDGLAEHERPDVVFLDLGLPDINGFTLLEYIAADPEKYGRVPILILTGHMNFQYLKQMHLANVVDYMVKPCRIARLDEHFRRLLKQKMAALAAH